MPSSSTSKRESRFLPGVQLDDSDRGDARSGRGRARRRDPAGGAGAGAARGRDARWPTHVARGTPVIACAKGIERGTHKFMTEIIAECAPNAVPAILSGPSFAADVARGLPTAVTLAAADDSVAGDARAGARLGDVPALSFDRRARRRDRRRGQERARDRGRHRHRPRARRQRRGGADHARLRRAGALRQGLRRAAGNADRACPASAI